MKFQDETLTTHFGRNVELIEDRVHGPGENDAMSVTHCVVVWEWWDGQSCWWLPHPPSVAQQLERAYAKKLTRVVLADADPDLVGYHVNLRTHTQTKDSPEGEIPVECGVRRSCYSVVSPGGRGARWEWAATPGRHDDAVWLHLSMEMQCRLEEAWSRGEDTSEIATSSGVWLVQFKALTARGPGGARRLIRRVTQAPYPLTKAPAPPVAVNGAIVTGTVQGRRGIPHQHTGSSTVSSTSAASARTVAGAERRGGGGGVGDGGGVAAGGGAEGAVAGKADRERSPQRAKHNIARQILQNLNIFNMKPAPACASPSEDERDGKRDNDSTSSRGRRVSQDTVSTYLSHDTAGQPPIGDLLNCSMGSDDVFETTTRAPPSRPKTPSSNGSIVGVDCASASVSVFVRVVESVQWGAVCPLCLGPLEGERVVVSLTHCQHMMHLQCLNVSLDRQRSHQDSLYIECGVCGAVYGGGGGGGGAGAGGERTGDQPAGSMAWCVQHRPLPNHPAHTNTIQITFNMVSGTQGPEHPSPGRPYYAVGFPRYSYLPDTPLGRRVLNLLCLAWERRLLFTIGRSQTTGREDVVSWARGVRVRGERAQYAAGALESAAHLRALARQLAAMGVEEGHLYQELS